MTGTAPRSRITWTNVSGVVPLIGNHILYGVRQEQRLSLGDIMGLACRELELERVAQGVPTLMWILLVKPPRLRPRACAPWPPF